MTAAVRASARRFVAPGSRVAVALSGGVDSVVLLHILASLRSELDLDLRALHVNHGLSPNAVEWEEFCSRTCSAHGIGLSLVRLRLVRHAGQSLEAQARSARYAALESAAADLGAGIVALAQHADDQAETVLLQLLRGAAAKGLSAMAEWRRAGAGCAWWRPLLRSTRVEIVGCARQAGLEWVEDESNADPAFRRNFLRAQVLPRLELGFPGYRTSLARTATHAVEAAQLLDQLADLDAAAVAHGDRIPLTALRELGALRASNLLRRMLAQRGHAVPPGERLAEFLRQAFGAAHDRHPALSLKEGHLLCADRGQVSIVLAPPAAPFELMWRGESEIVLPHGRLLFRRARGAGIRAALVPPSGLVVCSRGGGERLQIARNRPLRTLKNLMQEAGIPAAMRGRWPLILLAGDLVAVPGIGVGAAWQCPPDDDGWGIAWHPGEPSAGDPAG